MADQTWPPALRFSDLQFQLVSLSRSGGQTLSGVEQVVTSPAGIWRASVTVPVRPRDDAVLAYRGLIARLRGRVGAALVPVCDGRGPAARAGRPVVAVPHSDAALHSDGAGYGQPFSGGRLNAAAIRGATEIDVAMDGDVPVEGMYFSLPGGELHVVAQIVAITGPVYRLRVAPWLRIARAAGVRLDFDRPLCRMRLASDETGALSLSLNRFATPSIEFVEIV